MFRTKILQIAQSLVGVEEIVGPRHNSKIVDFARKIGQKWVVDDETPWCASFLGYVLESAGLLSTRKLNARSYLNWGIEVPLEYAKEGDVAVLWRGRKDGWKGHVAFYLAQRPGEILLLGGNQGNKVSKQWYPVSRLLSIRQAEEVFEEEKTPIGDATRVEEKSWVQHIIQLIYDIFRSKKNG